MNNAQSTRNVHSRVETSPTEKKPWRKPGVRPLPAVAEITMSNSNSGSDGLQVHS